MKAFWVLNMPLLIFYQQHYHNYTNVFYTWSFPYDRFSNCTHCFFIAKTVVTIIIIKAFLDFNFTWACFYVKLIPLSLKVDYILCSKGVFKGKCCKVLPFFQFLTITEISRLFSDHAVIMFHENIPKYLLLWYSTTKSLI